MKKQIGLFEESTSSSTAPMAYRMRPTKLSDFYGQEQILRRLKSVNYNKLPHIVFWGPPGCGKTTLANILATEANLELYAFNAVLGGVNDLRKLITEAISLKNLHGKTSVIFIDEIHRFNKAQQDALLPYLEKGDFILFGATTEYPQTSLNKAIISRVQVWGFEKLQTDDIFKILENAQEENQLNIDSKVIDYIASYSNGDARSALNSLELLDNTEIDTKSMSLEEIKNKIFNIQREYDKNSDRHYDVISAFIKSVRGSDVDAAILWLAVMLDGGEDPEFIARRLIILASEDIGNADPRGLQMATSCHYAVKNIGMPEARLILAQVTTYLSQAPKSNASYNAINSALEYVRTNPTIEVPTHLRNNHPDKRNYKYPHSFSNHWIQQEYHPDQLSFYQSSNLAYEKMQNDYLDKIRK
jgi:putative ATPase